MIERLLPGSVATAETHLDLVEIDLFPEEQCVIAKAVKKRRNEFVTGRACARQALDRMGVPLVAIASGARGEPLWPAGVVGSITHCQGYCACAVARSDQVLSLGIDTEVNRPLPQDVFRRVAFGPERDLLSVSSRVCVDMLLFSAKEAIYKAWFPIAKRWLGFEDVRVSIDVTHQSFCGYVCVPGPVIDGRVITVFPGRWCVEDNLLHTACAITYSHYSGAIQQSNAPIAVGGT
jgi:4'-phosphopantetheinyl transferase EntD